MFNLKCNSSLARKWVTKYRKFKYQKYLRKPALRKHHIEIRLQFAKKYVQKGNVWKRIIFIDEKTFNLNRSDKRRRLSDGMVKI